MATLTTIGRSAPTVIRSASRRNNDLHRCYSILLQPARTRIGSNVFPRNSTAPINFRRRLLSGTKDSNRNPQTVVEESSSASAGKVSTSSSNTSSFKSFWIWYLGPKEMPERWTLPWYREMVLICTVFAITGSSTMVLVRPAVSNGLGLKGSFKEGPWSFRICSLVIMTPIYATLLVVVGTVFGRHHYFRHFSVKMWSRFGIPPEMMDETYHVTKKTFRKW